MGLRGRIEIEPREEPGFAELRVWSGFHDLRQHLTVETVGRAETFELPHGWWTVSVPVPAGCSAVTLRADRQLPPSARPGDDRQLAVRVAAPRTHRDAARHRMVAGQLRNAILNTREGLEGRAELASTPTNLGIDMYGVCNVKPPCVYCDWDFAKALEKDDVEAPFNLDTLGDYGPFFENAASLVNCSIGEPFMMKDFDALLDAFGDGNKLVEMTTNGQILTDRNIGRLLGRRIELYVSLDAATAATYAKLRNDTFDRILANLRRLIAAKGGRGGLPRIHLVFMPMRVNMHELDGFVDLCADLDADRFVLRPLNEIGDELDWTRAGHHFVYSRERLDFDTLVRLSARAAARCRRRGVPFSNQLDFGGEMEPIYRRAFDEALAEANGPPADASPNRAERPDPERRSEGEPAPAPARVEPPDSEQRSEGGAEPAPARAERPDAESRPGGEPEPPRPLAARRRGGRRGRRRHARRGQAAGLPRAVEEPLRPAPRRHALLLRRPPPRRHGGVPRHLERPAPPGHPPPHRPRRVPRVLPGLAVLPHRAEEPPCPGRRRGRIGPAPARDDPPRARAPGSRAGVQARPQGVRPGAVGRSGDGAVPPPAADSPRPAAARGALTRLGRCGAAAEVHLPEVGSGAQQQHRERGGRRELPPELGLLPDEQGAEADEPRGGGEQVPVELGERLLAVGRLGAALDVAEDPERDVLPAVDAELVVGAVSRLRDRAQRLPVEGRVDGGLGGVVGAGGSWGMSPPAVVPMPTVYTRMRRSRASCSASSTSPLQAWPSDSTMNALALRRSPWSWASRSNICTPQ